MMLSHDNDDVGETNLDPIKCYQILCYSSVLTATRFWSTTMATSSSILTSGLWYDRQSLSFYTIT